MMGKAWLKRYARLYWQFFKMHLKVMMEYRTDFYIGVASVFFVQGASVFFVKVVFDHIESIQGWTYYEVLFIYGIALTGRSLEHIFFDSLWIIGWNYIRSGQFDRLLVRPVNPLFQIIAERVQQDGFGHLIIGLFVLGTSMHHLDIVWGWPDFLMLAVMIVSSGAIFMSINLFFATLSFWMVDSFPIMLAVHGLNDFARYPLTIYNKGIRFLLTWIIPYGFTAFYPSAYFISHSGYRSTALWSPFAAAAACVIAYLFWKKGLKSFTSTGT